MSLSPEEALRTGIVIKSQQGDTLLEFDLGYYEDTPEDLFDDLRQAAHQALAKAELVNKEINVDHIADRLGVDPGEVAARLEGLL